MLLVPDRAIGSDQGGRYVLVAGKDDVVEQRTVEIGQLVGELRVIAPASAADDRVVISGLLSAVPGQKVEPQLKTARRGRGGRRRAMISKFFIERPIFANVIAIVTMVIGVVSLFAPAGRAVPERDAADRPGHHALSRRQRAHGDRHRGLPIEQQVNGVEGMLYMQSYAATDGTYTLTVTFEIGTDLDPAQVLVQNRVSSAHGGAAAGGAGAGRHRPEEVDGHPRDRHADLAGRTATTASISATTRRSG